MTWKNRESIFVFRNVVNLYIFKGTYNAQTMPSICIDRCKIRLGGGPWTQREKSRRIGRLRHLPVLLSESTPPPRCCTIPLPLSASGGIWCAPPTPRPVLAFIFPHSLCKLPDAEFSLSSLLRSSCDCCSGPSCWGWDGLAWMLACGLQACPSLPPIPCDAFWTNGYWCAIWYDIFSRCVNWMIYFNAVWTKLIYYTRLL